MAIAFDATSSSTFTSTNSKTVSHTCTGANGYLIAFVMREGGVTVSSITYGGVAMSLISSVNLGADANKGCYAYGLVNPASGANNISVTFSGTAYNGIQGVSYSGVNQTSPVEVSTTANPVGVRNTLSATLSVGVANTWLVAWARFDNGGTLSGTNDTTTIRNNTTDGGNVVVDSNGTVATGTRTVGAAAGNNGNAILIGFNIETAAAVASTIPDARLFFI